MLKKIFTFLLFVVVLSQGGTFSSNTGLVLTGSGGKTYDIDALIASGYHIMVHQTGST